MARPQTKAELITAAETNYTKLLELLESMTEEERCTTFDFSGDEKKKEAHWKRDKNVRDVLIHLHEWHNLMLEWLNNMNEKVIVKKPFLMEGYTWKTYGAMNHLFWDRCQGVDEKEAMQRFQQSHASIMEEIKKFPEDDIFRKAPYDWVGTSSIGSYFVSVTSSHYDWAMKKIKAHRKKVNGR